MNENDELKTRVAALEARVEGLEDLLHSAGEWLRSYADYAASQQPGKIKPPIARGSESFTEKHVSILNSIRG